MLAQAEDGGKGLKRTLGAGNLVALGVGAIIGAGLFVRTAAAAGQGWQTFQLLHSRKNSGVAARN